MYVLISGTKERYDRPIELDIIGHYETEEEASEDLKKYLPLYIEGLEEAINNRQEDFKKDWSDTALLFGYSNKGNLIYYSTQCPLDNEYEGDTYQIYEI